MASEKYFYRARYKYVPDGDDESDIPDIAMDIGDIMEVAKPLEDPTEDPEKPQGWLKGYNKTQQVYGYFPGNHVEAIKVEEAQESAQPGRCFRSVETFIILFAFFSNMAIS